MEPINTNTGTTYLSAMLRESTMAAHKNAESGTFIKDLFTGRCKPEDYVKYLWAFRQVYKALEKALAASSKNEAVQLINFQQLYRAEALNSDLNVWNKNTPLSIPENLKTAVDQYVSRIESIAELKPELLVAHAYVRYLGDLSGGQMLHKVLSKNSPIDNGFQFYVFDNIDATEMKTLYRQRLDEIGNKKPRIIKDICIEAGLVFDFNGALFRALGNN